MTRTIIVDERQVLAARIIMERAALGLQEADDEVRAYAAARQIGDSYDYEVVLEDQPA